MRRMARRWTTAAAARAAKEVPALRELRERLRLAEDGAELQLLAYVGSIPSRTVRHAAYHALGLNLAESAVVHRGAEIRSPKRIAIGRGSIIGFDAILDGRNGISIGANVNLSSEVAIWTAEHDPDHPRFHATGSPVVVADRAWLSFRSTILPGVTVGEGAVVAAGAVVTRDVSPFTVVAGIPAKEIGQRRRDLEYDLSRVRKPWFV